MSDLATFKGTYSDIKLIRSRKVAVVCVEIPIESATAFVKAFGMPDPASETWVALARINNMQDDTPKEKRPFKRRFNDLPPTEQAVLACKREAFWVFLDIWDGGTEGSIKNELDAAIAVRCYCHVDSRSELSKNAHAAKAWSNLYHDFQLWLGEKNI